MGKHYGRKRFNPGQKHALNNKLREAERKRRPFPNFDEWFAKHDELNYGPYDTDDYSYAQGNYDQARYDAQDSDGLDDDEAYEKDWSDRTPERKSYQYWYGDKNNVGSIGIPDDALHDYMFDDSHGETVHDARYRSNMGHMHNNYLEDKLNNMGQGTYKSNNPKSIDFTIQKPNPLLTHDFNKTHKEYEKQLKKTKLLDKHEGRATVQFLEEHTKPAFSDSTKTIGETVLPQAQQWTDQGTKSLYFKNKKKKK